MEQKTKITVRMRTDWMSEFARKYGRENILHISTRCDVPTTFFALCLAPFFLVFVPRLDDGDAPWVEVVRGLASDRSDYF